MQEIWKDVSKYEGLYQVSNFGRVKSLAGVKYKESRVIKNIPRNGYLSVILCNGTSKKNVFVHRLVAQCFVDNPESKPVVNHIDGNKQNCRFDNLEWCTQKDNVIHAYKNGLSTNLKRKPVYQFDKNGILIKKWDSVYQISESLNYKIKSLRNCIYGERKTAYGYIWSTVPSFEECSSKYKKRGTCKNKKHVLQYSLNGTLINKFDSQSEAVKETGFFQTGISLCLNGKKKHYKKYIWRYEDE